MITPKQELRVQEGEFADLATKRLVRIIIVLHSWHISTQSDGTL